MRCERAASGEITVMTPAGGRSGQRNLKLGALLDAWVAASGLGAAFDSSTGFKLPGGAILSPDASWVAGPRWEALTEAEQEGFPPLCPDFVVELKSPSDSWRKLQKKMEEYRARGARLGWLIDPEKRRVKVYRPGSLAESLQDPPTLSGEDVLPGFVLDLTEIWSERE